MTRSWLAALLLLTASGTAASAQELQWQPVPPLPALPENNAANTVVAKPLLWEPVPAATEPPTSTLTSTSTTPPPPPTTLVWEPVTPSDSTPSSTSIAVMPEANPTISANAGLVWEPVDSESVIVAEEVTTPPPGANSAEEAIATARAAIDQKAATFANDRALWRNERWYPQISSDVPVGFGPTGVMTTFALNAIDCTASGVCEGTSDWNNYLDQIERFGEAQFDWSLGAGDSQHLVGLVATTSFEETSIPLGDRNNQSNRSTNGLFDNYYIGLHLSRNLGIDTAVRIGVENWIDVKTCGLSCGFPKSAYGVISQRIRLKSDQSSWFANAYLTLGAGNGEFRSLEEKFRASVTAQRDAGCSTFGYLPDQPCSSDTRRRAVLSAANYGQLTPIGSAAVEVYPGVNVIGEWSQGNLNAGFSVRPFKDFGLVVTSMWNTLLPTTCDYGCTVTINGVPASIEDNLTTQRSKFSITASLGVKF